MSKEDKKARKREQDRLRKKKQRANENERKLAMAYDMLELPISATEREQLTKQVQIRDFEHPHEYLLTLMRIDGERIKHDQKAIGTCQECKLPLPQGCDKVFKGQRNCEYIQGLPIVEIFRG